MADENNDFVNYRDISDFKRNLEGMKSRKDISTKELYEAVQKLAQTTTGILEVFAAAAEQIKSEDKVYETDLKKHEAIISKLDKIIEQNRTIAEALVGVVDMVKEKVQPSAKDREELFFKPKQEQQTFPSSTQQTWKPNVEAFGTRQSAMIPPPIPTSPISVGMPSSFETSTQQLQSPQPPEIGVPKELFGLNSDFENEMMDMQPAPSPDFNLNEEPLELGESPKKKGLFGMFKK